jgi:hypothetical protein
MSRFLPVLILALVPSATMGQCFLSAGNPVGGSGNMGVLGKRTMTLMGFYKNSISDRFYEGSSQSPVSVIKNANFNYLGALLAYGATNKLTIETELGYFINKTKNYKIPEGYSLRAFGLNNAVVSGKYQLYFNPDKNIEYSAALGVKVPFTLKSQSFDNVRLPFDLQPSTSAFGLVFQSYLIKEHSYTGMRYFLYNRVEVNQTNRDGYRFGNVFQNSLFISRHLIRTSNWPVNITLILQIRNEILGRTFIGKEPEKASGSVKFLLAPQVNLSFNDKLYLSLMADVPVYQYYNYVQLANRVAFTVVLIKPVQFGGS